MTANATIERLQNAIKETDTFELSNYFDISKMFLLPAWLNAWQGGPPYKRSGGFV